MEHELFMPIDDLKKMRLRLRISQQMFWNRIDIHQATGSHLERLNKCSKAITAMLRLAYYTGPDDVLAKYRRGNTLDAKLFASVPNLKILREWHCLSQQKFWEPVGATQTCGSRYKSGKTLIPKCVCALVRLVYIDKTLSLSDGSSLYAVSDKNLR